MAMNTVCSHLTVAEEAFLKAVLWEEWNLVNGPATKTAQEQNLSLLRCLEVANQLSPNLHGEALVELHNGPAPAADWPWSGLTGPEVLELLWARHAKVAG